MKDRRNSVEAKPLKKFTVRAIAYIVVMAEDGAGAVLEARASKKSNWDIGYIDLAEELKD